MERKYSIDIPALIRMVLEIVAIIALGKYIGWWG